MSSLRFRLIVLVLLAVTPAFGLILHNNFEERQQDIAQTHADALRLTQLAAGSHTQIVENTHQLLMTLAQLPQIQERDFAACNLMLSQLQQKNQAYANLGVVDQQGNLRCSASPRQQAIKPDQQGFQKAIQTGDFAVGNYQINPIIHASTLNLSYPLRDQTGQITGVIYADLALSWLKQLVTTAQLPPGSAFLIVDQQGVILARDPNPETWVGQSISNHSLVRNTLKQPRQRIVEAPGVDGVLRLYAFTPLQRIAAQNSLYISVGIPKQSITTRAEQTLTRSLTALGIGSAIALIAAWIGSDRFILRWVKALVKATQRLASGNISIRSGVPHGLGELSQLAHSFDQMAESLERTLRERNLAQAALQASHRLLETVNAKLRTLIQSAPIAIDIIDQQGNVQLWNPAAERMFGWSEQEMMRKPLAIVPPNKQSELQGFLQALQQGETLTEVETQRMRKDGLLIDINLSAAPLHDAEGNLIGGIGILADITERKRLEREREQFLEQLKQETKDLAALVTVTTNAISTLELDELLQVLLQRVVEVTQADSAMILLQEDDQLVVRARVGMEDHLPVGYAVPIGPNFAGIIATTQKPLYIEDVQANPSVLVNQLSQPSSIRTMLGVPLKRFRETIGVLHIDWLTVHPYSDRELHLLEITAERCAMAIVNAQLYEDLRKREKLYRTLTQNFPNGAVFLFDHDLRYTLAEGKGLRTISLFPKYFLGKTLEETSPPETYQQLEPIYRATLTGVSSCFETAYSDHFYLVNTLPIRNEQGQIFAGMIVTQDITKRHQAEKALEKRERYLAALVKVQRQLLVLDEPESYSTEILKPLGEASGASRVYIFENHQDVDGQLLMSQRAEWCADGIQPEINNPVLQNLSYERFFPRWAEVLGRGESIAGKVAEFPESERLILQPQSICSVLIFPLLVHGEFFGFIGFDNCINTQAWEPSEIDLLQAAAAALSLAQERRQAKADLLKANERFYLASTAINSIIYDWDIDTRTVERTQGIYDVLGYHPEEAEPTVDWWRDRLHPDDKQQLQAQVTAALANQSYYSLEYRVRHKNEQYRYVWDKGRIIRNTEGHQVRVVGSTLDITERKQAEAALQQSEQQLQAILDNSTAVVYLKDTQGQFLLVNRCFETLFGVTKEQVIGKTDQDLFPSALAATFRANDQKVLAARSPLELEEIIPDHQGLSTYLSIKFPLCHADGVPYAICGISTNITDRKQAEEALRESERRYHTLAKVSPVGIFHTDARGQCIYVNKRWCQMSGLTLEQSLGGGWLSALHPEDQERIIASWVRSVQENLPFKSEYRFQRPDGEITWVFGQAIADIGSDGEILGYVGTVTDISDRKLAEEQLRQNAFYDSLTGLFNRAFFLECLGTVIEQAKQHPTHVFAVLFLDLTRFQIVKYSLGHLVADQLLISTAHRIQSCLQPTDIAARVGLDEFTILLGEIHQLSDAIAIAEQIHQQITLPFNLDGHEVFVSASIGIAFGDYHSQLTAGFNRPEDFLQAADTAMHQGKRLGQLPYAVFEPMMHAHAVARLQLDTDLRWALERQEFQLHYQPIVSLSTRQIIGFEALIRWQHPQKGIVSPAEFIPVTEETGLIIAIGQWVLLEACQQLHIWQQKFPSDPPLTMSVNLSGVQFRQPDLIEQIDRILQVTNLKPGSLKLEITESVVMDHAESATALLQQLKARNIQLAMDDFGTGYSSLSYLHRFPVDTLKIDRSFVSLMDVEGGNLEIVRTITTLAHYLGMDLIAEGIETAAQMERLQALQCEYGQGYLFSKPVDSEAAGKLLETGLPSR